MLWLWVTISAYFLFAVVSLIDKYILTGPPNPKIYSFYVGVLGILVLVLIPWVSFFVPTWWVIGLSFLAGTFLILGLFGLYTALEYFEASRVVPALGAFIPLFTFGLVNLVPGREASFSAQVLISFILLLAGSILITFRTKQAFFTKSLKISAVAALLFSLSFFLTKQVYLNVPFWNGFIWIRVGGFIAALSFLFTKEVKQEIFEHKFTFQKKTGTLFVINQGLGAGAAILENWAIALAGLAFLPIINALQGIEYAFIFIFAVLLSLKMPVLEEELTRKVILQKTIAILLIGAGLVLLNL